MLKQLVLISTLFTVSLSAQLDTPFVFVHGLGGDANQAVYYVKDNRIGDVHLTRPINWSILSQNVISFNLPHVKGNGDVDNDKVSLGQHFELDALHQHVPQDKDFVGFGLSMGAATWLNYAGTHSMQHSKGLILEAPFDRAETVAQHQTSQMNLGFLNSIGLGTFVMNWFVFKKYNPSGITPIKAAKNIRRDLPMLIVHSREDELIPVKCSRNICEQLKKNGHQELYYLELEHGKHANYMVGNDAKKYQIVTHAFLKKFNALHDEQLAAAGEAVLERCKI